MRIAVCIKQVPADQEGRMDPESGVMIREGGTCINPYDLCALENALRLRERLGGSITAFTMGPASAVTVLREACALGVDDGVLVCDTAFRGADVLATSHTLAQAMLTELPFDLILCGRQTTDGDTAQVGPALAAQLGIPCVGWVEALTDCDVTGITARQLQSDCSCDIRLPFPCLLCMEQISAQPRLPGLKLKLAAAKKSYRMVGLTDLTDGDCEHYGLKGSPTRVRRVFTPETAQKSELLRGEPQALAVQVTALLLSVAAENGGGAI